MPNAAKMFKKWFIELLNYLEEPSIIVIGSASNNSTLVENHSKINRKIVDVQKGLTEKNIKFHPLKTLPELHYKFKTIIIRGKNTCFGQIALENGHEVIFKPTLSFSLQIQPNRIYMA